MTSLHLYKALHKREYQAGTGPARSTYRYGNGARRPLNPDADSGLRLTKSQEQSGTVVAWMFFAAIAIAFGSWLAYAIGGLIARAMGWAG